MKRRVVYCPGYDLRPEQTSFALIRSEFEQFLRIRQVDGEFSQFKGGLDPGGSTATWHGRVEWPDSAAETLFVQLGWRDVIKPDFERSGWRRLAEAFWSFFLYARAGGYQAAFRSNWAHGLFCLYPAVGLALYLMVSLLPPALLAPAILDSFGSAAFSGYARIPSWAGLLAGSGLWMAAVYAFTQRLEPWSYFWYLVNSWYFMARLARNDHPQMQARIEEFADLIVDLSAEEDEDLVFVSHSCGTFLAIYILAAVLRRKPDIGRRRGGFTFVTLGPAFECLGGFGARRGFGEAMASVVTAGIDWTDIYGPHDLVCGGRTTPVARYASPGLAGQPMPEPRRFSVRIPDRMSERKFRYLRFRFFQLHFCYFLASVRPGLFDFYLLSLGPKRSDRQLQAWADGRD